MHKFTDPTALSRMAANESRSLKIPVVDISGNGPEVGDRLVEAVIKCGFVFVRGKALEFDSDVINRTFNLVTMKPYLYCCLVKVINKLTG